MENLAKVIPQVHKFVQCCSGLSALTRFLIIRVEVARYESPALRMENLATAIQQVHNIVQCCSGLRALTCFPIIPADFARPHGN